MARELVSKSSITGEVKAYAGPTAPEGYLLCQGQAVSRTTYSGLFSVLGTSHGQGDGLTTFNLPDYRGTFLRGRVNISTVTGTGTASLNNATFTSHGLNRTGFKVRLSSGTLSGLATATDYFAIIIDSNTLAFATSLANAIAGTKVAISGLNSAVIVQFEDPDYTSRVAATVGGNSAGALGSIQDDTNKLHGHPVRWNNQASGGADLAGGIMLNGDAVIDTASYTGTVTSTRGQNIGGDGGSESRPKNSLINYIIKY
jgi:microcystin-dependent protein